MGLNRRCSHNIVISMVLALVVILVIATIPTLANGEPGGPGNGQVPVSETISAPEGPLYLVPNDVTGVNSGNSTPIHDYGPNRLMVIPRIDSLPKSVRNHLTVVNDTTKLVYRGWKGRVPEMSDAEVANLGDGYYLLSLIGPVDPDWSELFTSFGVRIVDRASPYGLVVHASGDQLIGAVLSVTSSYGYTVIRGIRPIPVEARISGELLSVMRGRKKLTDIKGLRRTEDGSAVARLFFFNDSLPEKKPLDKRNALLAKALKNTRKPNADISYGFDDAILIKDPQELNKILQSTPSVQYVELIHERQTEDHAQVSYPIATAVAPPLYKTKPIAPKAVEKPRVMPEEEIPSWVNGKDKPSTDTNILSESAVLQDKVGEKAMPTPIKTFEGLGDGLAGFSVGVAPPDTEGDVGPNYYVQWVNCSFAIFDKTTGSVVYGPANGNTLFSGLGGRCESDNSGDPLVMYDSIADRWFMSQFAVGGSPYTQCIAVSQTNNPITTSWNLYAYEYGSNMNDYGKSGVWPDGYYMMYHMFANAASWAGTEVCVFDRVQMLDGNVATQQCFGPNSSYGGLLPSHFQGTTLPPAGSPNYFLAYGTSGHLLLWPFHVDWDNTSNTTFPSSSPTIISVAAFTDASSTSIPQKDTSQKLDTLGDRLMWRMNYRNFGDHESLVFNHSIMGGAGTGVRWYEIRNMSTTPTVYQQGTFAPSDTTWRWMGSVNMDMNGDIAAGYSGSSSNLNPSLMYSGRLVSDALGTFGQGEATLYSGTGSQTSGLSRWGDYSSLSIDPSDDCTFWFTSEYLTSNGSFNWHTRIGSFKFPSCGCITPGVPTIGTVTVPGDNQLRVSWTAGAPAGDTYNIYRSTGACPGGTFTQIASGVSSSPYTDNTVDGAVAYSYKVSAVDDTGNCESDQSGCAWNTATGSCISPPTFSGLETVTTPNDATCELDLAWSAATHNCSSSVVYNIYKSTSSGFTPGVANRIATCQSGTSYTDTDGLVNGTTYYYVVRAEDNSSNGSGPCASGNEDTNVIEVSGIPMGPLTVPIDEDFEEAGGEPTSGGTWSHSEADGTDDWAHSNNGNPHSLTHTFFCSDVNSLKDDFLVTPEFSVSSGSTLSFWHTYEMESGFDGCVIEISTNGGSSWTDLGPDITSGGYNDTISTSYSSPIGGRGAWSGGSIGTETEVAVGLSDYAGQTAQVRFRLACDTSVASTGWYIDDVTISASGSCSTASAVVKPVPDGKWVAGTASTASKNNSDGTSIGVSWDVSTCVGDNYNLYYGNGSNLSSYTLAGSDCDMGTSGSSTWTAPAMPGGEDFIWWVIVGTDGSSTESSWGKDSTGSERHAAASNQCGFTTKNTSGTCP